MRLLIGIIQSIHLQFDRPQRITNAPLWGARGARKSGGKFRQINRGPMAAIGAVWGAKAPQLVAGVCGAPAPNKKIELEMN